VTEGFCIFDDGLVKFKYPKYLERQKKDFQGQYLFMPNRRNPNWWQEMLEIVLSPSDLHIRRSHILAPVLYSDAFAERNLIYKGECQLRKGGICCITKSRAIRTNEEDYQWQLLFEIYGKAILVRIEGSGRFKDKRAVWEEVISSIELIEGEVTIRKNDLSVAPEIRSFSAKGSDGGVLELSKQFNIDAIDSIFYLRDGIAFSPPPVDYSEENMEDRLHLSNHIVAINPYRETDIPVWIKICSSAPEVELDRWDHIVECSLDIISGQIELSESTGGTIAVFLAPAGTYRVRTTFSGLSSISPDRMGGNDSYHIALWLAPWDELRVLKKYSRNL